MSDFRLLAGLMVMCLGFATLQLSAQPISLHPENQHYFLYKNKPTVLITSGEHYGGTVALRQQLGYLKKFMDTFDFIKMKPDRSFLTGGLPAGARIHVLSEPGKQYAAYIRKGNQVNIKVTLPQGTYRVEWTDPVTGSSLKKGGFQHSGGEASLSSPQYVYDISLKIINTKK